MRDRRSVDDLSIEELERILAIKKRQAREDRMRRYEQSGRRVSVPAPDDALPPLADLEDEIPLPADPEEDFETADARPKGGKDRVLLYVELAAIGGLLTLMVLTGLSLRDLNRESAEALALPALPTASATPLISAVVLPSGHTPPTSPGGAQPNYSEVPEHLRPLVEQSFLGPAIVPTPGPGNATRITIPSIGVDAPVVEGTGWEQLKKGVGHYMGSANPGQTGNTVLSAHNDIFGEIFRDLDQLDEGDEIVIQTTTRSYTYVVRDTRIVEPTDISVMNATHEPTTTLISCYPYLVDSQRIVVVAELADG
jgi:sortase A